MTLKLHFQWHAYLSYEERLKLSFIQHLVNFSVLEVTFLEFAADEAQNVC